MLADSVIGATRIKSLAIKHWAGRMHAHSNYLGNIIVTEILNIVPATRYQFVCHLLVNLLQNFNISPHKTIILCW